jgi:hypothetical protein
MDADLKGRGELTGKIYGRMLRFLDEQGKEVRPIDVVRWWAFWEKVVPSDLNPGRMFWAALVTTVRLLDDAEKTKALFNELEGWLTGQDFVSVEIVHLDDDPKPSQN